MSEKTRLNETVSEDEGSLGLDTFDMCSSE